MDPNWLKVVTYVMIALIVIGRFAGLLVHRRTLELVAQSRDQWREATRVNQQEVEQWQTYHAELAAVVEWQEQTLASHGVRPPKPKAVTQQVDRLKSLQRQNHFVAALGVAPDPMHFEPKTPSDTPACDHPEAVDVEISTGEVVAQICTTCGHQTVMDAWKEVTLVDEATRTVRTQEADPVPPEVRSATRARLGLKPEPQHKSTKVGCGYCGKMIHDHTCPHRQCQNGHTLRPGASWCNRCDEERCTTCDATMAQHSKGWSNHPFNEPWPSCPNCGGDHSRDDCPYPS